MLLRLMCTTTLSVNVPALLDPAGFNSVLRAAACTTLDDEEAAEKEYHSAGTAIITKRTDVISFS